MIILGCIAGYEGVREGGEIQYGKKENDVEVMNCFLLFFCFCCYVQSVRTLRTSVWVDAN